jgi:hypothetical protein
VIYRWKWNLAERNFTGVDTILVAEDTEIGFPAPEEAGRQDAACLRMLQLAWQEGLQECHRVKQMARTGQAGPVQCCRIRGVSKFNFRW